MTTATPAPTSSPTLLETHLSPDTVSLIYTFLDTISLVTLSSVSSGICHQARHEVKSIPSEVVCCKRGPFADGGGDDPMASAAADRRIAGFASSSSCLSLLPWKRGRGRTRTRAQAPRNTQQPDARAHAHVPKRGWLLSLLFKPSSSSSASHPPSSPSRSSWKAGGLFHRCFHPHTHSNSYIRPPTALALLITELPHYPRLEHLSLEYRNFTCEEAKTLAWMLEQAEEGVQEGQAQGGGSHTHAATTTTPITTTPSVSPPSSSPPTLPHRRSSCCTHLQSLTISNNFLSKDGALALSHALSLLPSLRALTLNDNSLYNEGATAICTSLKQGACPRLEQLSVAWNWIGVGGNKAMGALLGSGACVNLRVLDMRGNGITSVGLCFFVEELMISMVVAQEGEEGEGDGKEGEAVRMTAAVGGTSMYQRHYLHYQPEDAGPRGSSGSSSSAVPFPCPHLTELLLAFNYIGSEGVLALAEAVTLGIFPSLRTLDLSHNSVDEASEQTLREAFEGRNCNVVF